MHMGYPSYIHATDDHPAEEHWDTLPDDLKQDLLAYIDSYQPPREGELDGPCCWLDQETRLCKNHQFRPRVCRVFEVGSKDCLDWRKVYADRIT